MGAQYGGRNGLENRYLEMRCGIVTHPIRQIKHHEGIILYIMRNKYEVKEDYVIIYMKNRKIGIFETLVDLEDLDRLLKFDVTWYPFYDNSNGAYYGRSTEYLGLKNGKPKYKLHYLQKYIINYTQLDKKICVDHINHNTLDNRRKNLRIAEYKNNLRHRQTKNKNNTSGYRNVCFIEKWWRVQLQVLGKNHLFPEKFESASDAGEFAKEMREKYYGEYAGNN